MTEQLDYAVEKANLILTRPDFPAEEFAKLQRQSVQGLIQSLAQPGTVASREFSKALYEGGPQGRAATPQGLSALTVDDVKQWYQTVFKPAGGVMS